MIRIHLLCVGKPGERHYRDACAEYEKRLGGLCRLTITESEESRLPDRPSDAQISAAVESEGRKMLSKADPSSVIIAMCIEGKPMSSVEFADYLSRMAVSGNGSFSLFIGGSWGLSDEIKNRASLRLSMSPMTFPHQLARVMVYEQTYRALNMLNGGKYHK